MAYRFKHGDRPLDDYTIQRAVGTGGFGEVYYAVSDGGREVALKYLAQNPQIELRGVSHCINLKSPHLVSIFDVKKNADGDYFVIMEYCSGPSLRDVLIAEPNGFAPEKAAFFTREIAKGLSYLHERGIVHRDLKPGNIFYDDGYVKIGDYGLSKFIAVSRHSAQTASVGTVHYMAPEIGSGNYSRGVDIYALGVMLYEMLLGKVPFEGSSMAEVLMKHLTSQPELEDLPAPFGQVIRKALEKDPNDRYQTADEMVDDLLAVETVKESLAGFSPQSLDGAVHGGGRGHVDSPMPSPNPAPGYARDFARPRPDAHGATPGMDAGAPLPAGMAARMDHISRRVEHRMAQLAGRPAGPKPRLRPAAFRAGNLPPGGGSHARGDVGRFRLMLPALLLTAALATGLGVGFAQGFGDDAGGSAAMFTLFVPLGVALSRMATRWFGADTGPRWAGAVVRVCACAPLMFLAATPIFENNQTDNGFALVLGFLVVILFGDWDKARETGERGELGIGHAIWMGCGAGLIATILSGIFAEGDKTEHVMALAAASAAAAVLVVQANAWWIGAGRGAPSAKPGPGGAPADPQLLAGAAEAVRTAAEAEPPFALPIGYETRAPQYAAHTSATAAGVAGARQRLWATRAFWSVVAFILMGGMLVTFLLTLIDSNISYEDRTGAIIGCIACGSFMIFALLKTTMYKRDGFWRETVRPFLISSVMVGIGAPIVYLARGIQCGKYYDGRHMVPGRFISDGYVCRDLCSDEMVGVITGLVLCSLLFIILTLFTGWKRKPRPQFVMNAGADGDAGQPEGDVSATEEA